MIIVLINNNVARNCSAASKTAAPVTITMLDECAFYGSAKTMERMAAGESNKCNILTGIEEICNNINNNKNINIRIVIESEGRRHER